jgi:hypothetical protein
MKRIFFIITLLLAAFILINAGAAQAQGGASGWPWAIQDTRALTFDHFFLSFSTSQESPWKESNTVVDPSGGVHTTFYTNKSIYYAYCPSNCGDPANWLETPIAAVGTYDALSYSVLALDPAGHPRLMRYKSPHYTYAECNANCTQASNWTETEVPLAPGWSNISPDHGRYFALDAQGRPRFVVSYLELGVNGLGYASCDSGCTSPVNWQYWPLDIGGRLDGVQLVFNSSSQPRLVGINLNDGLDYVQCTTNCSSGANWSRVTLAADVGGMGIYHTYVLRLDAQGRPRVAFYKVANDNTLHYTWSNANFTNLSSWSSYAMPVPPEDYNRTLDLAIDSQGRPRIAYASAQQDLRYLECDTNCETQDAEWTAYDVETGEALNISDPLPPGTDCWVLDGYASLALAANNNPYISYHAAHGDVCGVYDAHAIRFATLGGAAQYAHQVYLPIIVR